MPWESFTRVLLQLERAASRKSSTRFRKELCENEQNLYDLLDKRASDQFEFHLFVVGCFCSTRGAKWAWKEGSENASIAAQALTQALEDCICLPVLFDSQAEPQASEIRPGHANFP